jgi:hypothetical protein
MAGASYAVTSFLGGEWSKWAQGRFDRPDYHTALNVCLNSLPTEQGALVRRPGTQFLSTTRNGQQARLIAFDIKASVPILMEFTPGIIRLFQSAQLVTTNDDKLITSISTANPAVVTTTTPHGWPATFSVKFANLGTAWPLLQNRTFIATSTGASTFTLADAVTGTNIDGSTLGAAPGAPASVQRILELVSPYTTTLWKDVRLVQTEQAGLLLHPLVATQVIKALPPGPTQTFYSFTIEPAIFSDGPYYDPVANGAQMAPSGTTGNITLTLQFSPWVSTTSYPVGALVLYSAVNYISLVDLNVGNQPDISPTKWQPTSAGSAIGANGFVGTDVGRLVRLFGSDGNWTWGKITQVETSIPPSSATSFSNAFSSEGNAFDGLTNVPAGNCATRSETNGDPFSFYIGLNYTVNQQIGHAVLWGSNNLGLYTANYTYQATTTTYIATASTAQVNYGSGSGTLMWAGGETVIGASSGATGVIVGILAGSNISRGTLTLANIVGFFQTGEVINGSAGSKAAVITAFTPGAADAWTSTGTSSANSTVNTTVTGFYINLRGKMTAPASGGDGTLLGQVLYGGAQSNFVPSSDLTTAWKYVWFELSVNGVVVTLPSNIDTRPPIGSVGVGATGYTTTYVFINFVVSAFVAEAQFYTPASTTTVVTGGNAVVLQLIGPALPNTNPISLWQLGLYSDTTGWPSAGTYHEGRAWLSGAVGNRIDASRSNGALQVINGVVSAVLDFAPSLFNGQVLDDSAIAGVFNAPDVNTIFWMVPDQLGIVAGTQAGDWLIRASAQNNPLTPTNFQVHRLSRLGCANIEPRRASGSLIFVQRFRKKLFEYFADVFNSQLSAQSISWMCRHLTKPSIAELAYQYELAPVIWVRCDDGTWFGMSYKRENNVSASPPNFIAPHRHLLGSNRSVESIATGHSPDGTMDSLSMVTNDPSTNVRHVEALTTLFEEGEAETTAWFLDDAVRPSSIVTTPGTVTLNGLWHLNLRTVTVFADGLDCGDFVVSNGAVTVPNTPAVVAGPIVVGFTYTSQGQLVRPMTPTESGARNGPALGKKRRTMQVAFMLEQAASISFGTDFARMYPAQFKTPAGQNYAPGQLFSGIFWNTVSDEWGFDSMPCWQMTRPYSATIVALEAFLETSDK